MVEFRGKSVLVTGGTGGLGKAIGLEFARAGATVFLTYHWGSVDTDELAAEFQAENLAPPHIVESDAGDLAATRELMTMVKDTAGTLDVFISNVAFSKVVNDLVDLKRNTFEISLRYSAWPIVDYVQAAYEVIGRFPRYVIGVSSDGGQVCHDAYDLAGASKAVLETFCRYLALRLKQHAVRVNVVRPGYMDTSSSRATFGEETIETMEKQVPGLFLAPSGVAKACLALCSGLMDAVTGQVIVVDEGWSLVSPVAYLTGHGLPAEFPK